MDDLFNKVLDAELKLCTRTFTDACVAAGLYVRRGDVNGDEIFQANGRVPTDQETERAFLEYQQMWTQLIRYIDDPSEGELESQRRGQLQATRFDWMTPGVEEGPVPSTADVLGVLRGDVELSVTYKPRNQLTLLDRQQLGDFLVAGSCLHALEADFILEVFPETPVGTTPFASRLNPEITAPMLQALRSRVDQELQERIQQFYEGD
jgi:hypothetical protein